MSYRAQRRFDVAVPMYERAEELKMAAFKRKKAQIEEVEPERMVTMCATCRTQLEEGLEEFNMDIPVIGLTEIIAEHRSR